MHDMIADAVEICGGSRHLTRLRCKSPPTLTIILLLNMLRHNTNTAYGNELPPTVFKTTSVDNFNML